MTAASPQRWVSAPVNYTISCLLALQKQTRRREGTMRKKTSLHELLCRMICAASVVLLLVGCSTPAILPTLTPTAATPVPRSASTSSFTPQAEKRTDGLSDQDAATLGSLKKVDDYPLYTMRYYGSLHQRTSSIDGSEWRARTDPPAWACSLFAALGDAGNMHYGRNFDWEHSPALLLFTDPPDGYASVSMVDVAYLGFGGTKASTLTDLPLAERRALLSAPFLSFDGMNERGLAIGMAAVPPGGMQPDPNKETIDSLLVIRKMLDQADNVDEALAIFQRYNISMGGGPPIHYLIADRSGHAALVEFCQGKLIVIPNDKPWHQATNFLRSAVSGSAEGQCWRYDTVYRQLSRTDGKITLKDAMSLLGDVSQNSTQWSIVYGMSTGDVNVTMGRQYDNVHTFHFDLARK
jgi:hypothetical protein